MEDQKKYKLVYEYYRGGYEPFPSFEEWMENPDTKKMSKEELDTQYNFALTAKERTSVYRKLVSENSYVLMNNGITDAEIDYVLSNEIINMNMDSEIERLLFIIETLKVYNIYDPNLKINKIETLGGGFYEDGYIFGYNININNNDKYRIELGRFTDEPSEDTNRLVFESSNNKELMTKQIEMLKKFTGFFNNQSVLDTIKVLDESLNKKMHI